MQGHPLRPVIYYIGLPIRAALPEDGLMFRILPIWPNQTRVGWGAALLLAVSLSLLALACGGGGAGPEPAAAPTAAAAPAASAPDATPTPPPDPAAILSETADNLRGAESFRFDVDHEAGSIYVSSVQAKAVKAVGGWNKAQGAEMTVDAYLVSGARAPVKDGTYVELNMAVTADSYFLTDPLSGYWTKRPLENISIPIVELNRIMAEAVEAIANPVLVGEEALDSGNAYKITGDAPASVMAWLLLFPEEGQRVNVELWTDAEAKILRKVRIAGAIGQYDDADTVRNVLITDYNKPVDIETPGPDDYLDLSDLQ